MPRYLQVATTIDTRQAAERLAATMVERRLAACAQVCAIHSTYWWENKLHSSDEWQCTFKTREDLYEDLAAAIREVHSYEVPEILATLIVQGNAAYLEWIDRELRSQE